MNKPHKHAELIKAWADGATIEHNCEKWEHWKPWKYWEGWVVAEHPSWDDNVEYRIKPEPKSDVVQLFFVDDSEPHQVWPSFQCETCENLNLKLTWDGETGKLKDAEVLK